MPPILFSLLIILFLTLLNSFFVASELALVSARRARLQQRAEAGEVGAAMALKLTEHPEIFLSSVQVCITLITIISGALGEKTLAVQLEPLLRRIPWLSSSSELISSILLILLLTYLSLVIGELAPKRLALNNAEGIAVWVAPALRLLTAVFRPVSRLLNYSTDLVLKLFGAQVRDDRQVTEDEIKIMIGQGTEEGVFEAIEEEMVGQVFRLSDRTISALLTPRTEIVWLDIDDSPEEIREKVIESGFSRFPVAEDELDNVLGLVTSNDLLAQSLAGKPLDLRSLLQPALFLPETTPALEMVERLRQTRSHIAMVVDEYGGLEGLVTLDDLLQAIVGDIPEHGDVVETEVTQREDGSWLVDGMLNIDDFQELLEIKELPDDNEGYYQTVGGFVMAMLGRVPAAGDGFEFEHYRLEVMDMDGRRVDKVLVSERSTERTLEYT